MFISPYGYYFGVCAPYISRDRCFDRRPPFFYIELPIYNGAIFQGYRNSQDYNYLPDSDLGQREPGLVNAIEEVEEAFRGANIDSMVALIDPDSDISIFLNGKYQYSMAANDYIDLTRDAIDSTRTVSFDLTSLHKRANGIYVAAGQHVYVDQSGRNRTVYVSFVLEDVDGQWTLTQVGTTPDQLQNWN